jgi:hypothetical protein
MKSAIIAFFCLFSFGWLTGCGHSKACEDTFNVMACGLEVKDQKGKGDFLDKCDKLDAAKQTAILNCMSAEKETYCKHFKALITKPDDQNALMGMVGIIGKCKAGDLG